MDSDGAEKNSARSRVLLVDDDAAVRRGIAKTMERLGYTVESASSGEEALTLLAAAPFDAVLSDIHMPGVDGLALLRAIRQRDLDVPVVLLTGVPDVPTAAAAVRYGAIEYLTKPVLRADLERSLARAVALGRLARAKRDALPQGAGDRAGLEIAFENASQTLWVAFQPILDRQGALYGHEALMRAKEPTLPNPGAVLDAAAVLGRGEELARRMRGLSAAAMAGDAVGWLFVNLLPQDLFDPELTDPESPLRVISERVVLEITERTSLEKLEHVRERTRELRQAGYRIAIDDLGAGYAGLAAFAVLEPEVVKLDIALVSKIEASRTKQRLVTSIVEASHDLGMLVLAEGVETASELQTVLELGCDLFQGYLLARPGPRFPTYQWPRPGSV